MQRYRKFRRGCLLLMIAGSAIPSVGTFAFADSVPESIRIQQQAEKAYQTAPVVPIERGNAHHREIMKDDGSDSGGVGGYEPVPETPPPAAQHHNSTK